MKADWVNKILLKTSNLFSPLSLLAHDPIMEDPNSTETIIMATLSTLTPPQLSDLTNSIGLLFHRHHHRLCTLLSSPTIFSLTLHHLYSLSIHDKSLLIARHLFSTLTHLTHYFHTNTTPPSYPATAIKLRDLDAVLLLLLLCELRQHDPEVLETSPSNWRVILCDYISDTMLKLPGIAVSNDAILFQYVEVVAKCRRFVGVMGRGGKEGREVAASVAAVVALPSVEVSGIGMECVICKEEMKEGRDVCELPCEHLFHWMCILPWLRKRNTCPCCRYRLPTDNLIDEIERLWEDLIKIGNGNSLHR